MLRRLFLVLCTMGLFACATVPQTAPPNPTNKTQPSLRSQDALLLTNAKVTWLDTYISRRITYRTSTALHEITPLTNVLRYKPPPAPLHGLTLPFVNTKLPSHLIRAGEVYIDKFLDAQRRFAAPKLVEALAKRGVAPGNEFSIRLLPIAVYHSAGGGGTYLLVTVEIEETGTGRNWGTMLTIKSGATVWNVALAPDPTDSSAQEFANELITVLQRAGAIS